MTPWVKRLLAANVVVFVVTLAVPDLMSRLLLVPALVLSRPWTPLTYMFLHAGIWHLAFNMIALFFFGPRLEMRLGSAHFLGLYFVSGLVAAAASFVFTPQARIVGASGAVFGVLLGFARYWPREQLLIWGVFPMEARWLVALLAGFSLFAGLGGSAGGIAHFAHLGGVAGGFAYLWIRERRRGRRGPEARVAEKLLEAARRGGSPDRGEVERWKSIDPSGLHQVNREHLENLQRKIQEEGPGSLTQRERAFLDRMSRRASTSGDEEGGGD